MDSLTDLVGGGAIWLLTPKVGRPNAVDAADIAEAAPIAGLSQTTTAAVSKDWAATRLVAPKSAQLTHRKEIAHRMAKAAERLTSGVTSAAVLARSGIIRPYSPRTLVRLGQDAQGRGGSARPAASPRWRCASPTRSG